MTAIDRIRKLMTLGLDRGATRAERDAAVAKARELMIEHGVHVWDVAAIKPIVEEAGGRFSNWDGGIDLYKPDVLVSNGRMHDEVLKILAGEQKG